MPLKALASRLTSSCRLIARDPPGGDTTDVEEALPGSEVQCRQPGHADGWIFDDRDVQALDLRLGQDVHAEGCISDDRIALGGGRQLDWLGVDAPTSASKDAVIVAWALLISIIASLLLVGRSRRSKAPPPQQDCGCGTENPKGEGAKPQTETGNPGSHANGPHDRPAHRVPRLIGLSCNSLVPGFPMFSHPPQIGGFTGTRTAYSCRWRLKLAGFESPD